jgi:hypothetical protein
MKKVSFTIHNKACEYADAKMFDEKKIESILPNTPAHKEWLHWYDLFIKEQEES